MAEKNELTEEDVFNDDKDPLEAIRELRKAEGVAEEDLPESSLEQDPSEAAASADNKDDDDLGELEPNTDDDAARTAAEAEAAAGKEDPDNGDEDPNKGDDPDPDGKEDEGEEDPEPKAEKQPAAKEPRTFKANGQEFTFTEEEILAQFETVFGQSMNYTQKMQKIAPYRKMISALEQEGLTHDQLNIAIDALKGDKGALQEIIKAHKIDAYDLGDKDDENAQPYQPTPYGKDEATLNIEEVSTRLKADKEYPITVDIIGNQWDDNSRSAFASNPSLIVGLHNDVKSGKYDEVAPVAMKMKVLDGSGKSDIEYYMLAGQQLQEQAEAAAAANAEAGQAKTEDLNSQSQAEISKNEAASSAAQKKRSASSTRTRADRQGVVDYLDDDDEKFDSWYNKLMSSN